MKIKLIKVLLLSSLAYGQSEIFKDSILASLSHEKYFIYQDIIINGETVFHGVGPDCSARYNILKSIFQQYNRSLKVLDLGANNGYFSFKCAHDFHATCVMMDMSDRLLELCYLNDKIQNIVYLKEKITVESLKLLAEYEHFDIIFAFNILHHLENCIEVCDLLFKLADIVVIETPPCNDPRVLEKPNILIINEYIKSKGDFKILGSVLRSVPHQFDHILTMNQNQNLYQSINYCDNVYAQIFYFESLHPLGVNGGIHKVVFEQLHGVYADKNLLKVE